MPRDLLDWPLQIVREVDLLLTRALLGAKLATLRAQNLLHARGSVLVLLHLQKQQENQF